MLGAIAGDLAAWTYEHDKDAFYAWLITKESELSNFGQVALNSASALVKDPSALLLAYPESEPGYLNHGERLIQCAQLAWLDTNNPDYHFKPYGILNEDLFYDDKQGWYAYHILTELIFNLRHGQTKKEVLADNHGKTLSDLMTHWSWKETKDNDGLLTYLMRAWDCFAKAWDFTSAIHNAARWENVNRHLLCSLTGALAEAMYGCEFSINKKKYNGGGTIQYPVCIASIVSEIQQYQFKNRVFFPKNSSLTNVEVHHYVKYVSRFEGHRVSEEMGKRILRAFYTGWDDRYGFYLDDGWVYCYRSGTLIARFILSPNPDKGFVMNNIQRSGSCINIEDDALDEALYSATHHY